MFLSSGILTILAVTGALDILFVSDPLLGKGRTSWMLSHTYSALCTTINLEYPSDIHIIVVSHYLATRLAQ